MKKKANEACMQLCMKSSWAINKLRSPPAAC